MSERGECIGCGVEYRVGRDGTIREHQYAGSRCKGSGCLPLPVPAPTRSESPRGNETRND